MSTEQVIAFWQRVQNDEQLQRRVHPSGGQVPKLHAGTQPAELGGLCRIAEDIGFTCTAEEFAAVEAVMRFWSQVHKDEQLQERLKTAEAMESHDQALAEVARIAGEAGFHFNAEQLDAVTRAHMEATGQLTSEGELSEEQLEQLAGGASGVPGYPLSFNYALSGQWAVNWEY